MGIMTGLLLLLWVDVTVSSVVDLQKRIIGGQDCKDNERLYHVKLTDFDGNLICGGSLVSDKWVLTAAHCWKLQMKAVLEVPGTRYPVTIQRPYIIEAPPQIYGENNKVHDIMLLQLPKTTTIKPVELPDCNGTTNGGEKKRIIVDVVQVAGFAATKPNSKGNKVSGESPKLQCAKTKFVHCDDIKKLMNKDMTYFNSWQHWDCFKADGVDICPGDSGGGVVYKTNDGTDYILGVLSFTSTRACTEPSASMDVCKYVDWIKKTIKK